MSFLRRRKRARRARVEMIPLIDCMFLLLTFFIYVRMTMTLQKGIPVDLAAATTGEAPKEERITHLSIDAGGRVYLDKRPVSEEELRAGLRSLALQAAPRPVLVQADKGVLHARVIEVVDWARQAGVPQVIFSVQARGEERS